MIWLIVAWWLFGFIAEFVITCCLDGRKTSFLDYLIAMILGFFMVLPLVCTYRQYRWLKKNGVKA